MYGLRSEGPWICRDVLAVSHLHIRAHVVSSKILFRYEIRKKGNLTEALFIIGAVRTMFEVVPGHYVICNSGLLQNDITQHPAA